MFNNHTTKIKTQLQAFKNNHGPMIFTFMVQCCLISIAFFAILFLIQGFDASFVDILEMLLLVPLCSIIVALLRIALKVVHKLLPYGGILQLIIDIITFAIVFAAIGYSSSFFPTMPAVVEFILLIGFDLLYITAILYFKKPDSPEE